MSPEELVTLDEYVPGASLDSCSPKPAPRALMYGVGLEMDNDTFGMTYGPSPDEIAMLEHAPMLPDGFDGNCVILRFNEDGSDDILWYWDDDRWKRPTRL